MSEQDLPAAEHDDHQPELPDSDWPVILLGGLGLVVGLISWGYVLSRVFA